MYHLDFQRESHIMNTCKYNAMQYNTVQSAFLNVFLEHLKVNI